MANNDDNLLREIEEEIRRERMEQIWKQYGTYLIIAAVALVTVVGGYQYHRSSQSAAATAAGAAFENAAYLVQEKKTEEAHKAFEDLAKSGPSGYAALARLRLAGLEMEKGDKPKALAHYEALAGASGADPLLKSFAQLQAAALKIGDADFTEVENRLNDLTNESSPWRSNARELISLAAMKAGKTDVARKSLNEILGDRTAPPRVRERAQIMMAEIIEADLEAKALETKAPPAAKDQAGDAPKAADGKAEGGKAEAAPAAKPADAGGADAEKK